MKDINGYTLSRAWFDFSFENPEKIRPIHSAIFFFAVEHCNRLGWKEKFGFPSQMAMEAIGIKNWKTYSKALNELVEFGFVSMIEKSQNQYSSNIITLKTAYVKNTEATGESLDKALSKHMANHSPKHVRSTVSIDKQINKEQLNKEQLLCESSNFDAFWNLYDIKKGKAKAKKKFEKLSEKNQELILENVPIFKTHYDEGYVPHPQTYLNNKYWLDDDFQVPRIKNEVGGKTNGRAENRTEQYIRRGQEIFGSDAV